MSSRKNPRSGRAPAEREIDALLALLERPDLSFHEAEQMLARLQPGPNLPREQIVERLLAVLEAVEGTAGVDGATRESDAGPRVATHDTAMILLSFLGDESVVPRLLALLDKRSLADDFKLKLISVIHEFDPHSSPDDLLGRLHNPYKTMQQSHREHLRRLQSPLELGFWLNVMVEEMPSEARISFARSSAEVNEPLAVPLLICLCYDEDPDVALAAMDAVERYKDVRALAALEELAVRYPNSVVRREAQKTADRVRIRASLAPQADLEPPPPFYLCHLTTIDGSGGQMALLARETSPGMLRVAQLMFVDETGIEDCFGMDILARNLDDLIQDLAERGLSPVDVPYAQFVETLEWACEETWNAGRLLPSSFVAWREWLTWEWVHEASAEPNPRAPTEPTPEQLFWRSLSDPERARLLHDCSELLYQDEFINWLFDEDEMDASADAFWELVEQGHGRPPEISAVCVLLRQVLQQIVTDQMRGLIRDRLWRVAPLLRDLYDEDQVWQWAVVAAATLGDNSPLPPEEHPFLLAMAAHSLENVVGAEIEWRS